MSSPSGVICWCFLALAVWHVSAVENPNAKDKTDDKYLSDAEAIQYMKDHPEYRPNYDFVPMDLAASTLTGGRDFENLDDRRPQDNRRPSQDDQRPQSPLKRQQSISAEEKRAFLRRQQSRDGRPNKLQKQNSGSKPANSPIRSDSQRLRAAAGLNKSPSIKSASLSKSKSLKKPGNSQGRSQSPRRAAAPAA